MPFAAAQLRTTRYSAGLIGSIAMPTYDSTRVRRLYLECWSIGSMIGCSLQMLTMSRGGFARLSRARPRAVHWLVFDAEALNHVDATGVRTLTELIESP